MAVARPSIVERRCWYSVIFAGDRLLAQLEDKVAGMTLVGAEHHGLRAIGIGLDQRVPTGAFTVAVATRTRSVQRADTVAPTEDLVGARHVRVSPESPRGLALMSPQLGQAHDQKRFRLASEKHTVPPRGDRAHGRGLFFLAA